MELNSFPVVLIVEMKDLELFQRELVSDVFIDKIYKCF